jgi:hypothetical protein
VRRVLVPSSQAVRRAAVSTHGVRGLVEVDDRGLGLDHHGQAVADALAADAALAEALEREVVWAARWRRVDLRADAGAIWLKGRAGVECKLARLGV